MSRESLRAFMNAPTPDDPALLAEGFTASARFAGCLIKPAPDGEYVVFRPIDTRSGKYEMYYQRAGKRTDFPPTTARGIVKQVRDHRASK